MSQRNPLNERYTSEDKIGKTRKSAASAKPAAKRAATVRSAPQKSKKERRAEQRERERRADTKRYRAQQDLYNVPTEEYKRLRRTWWIVLVAAIACTVLSFALSTISGLEAVSTACLVVGYALILLALYIDFGKTRKLRKQYAAQVAGNRSKAARAEQKRTRAEQRALEAEAKESLQDTEGEKPQKKGLFSKLFKR